MIPFYTHSFVCAVDVAKPNMKLTPRLGRLVFGLGSLVGLVQSFPTAENLARLAQSEGLTARQIHDHLAELQQKRQLFDPLSTPIQGIYETF